MESQLMRDWREGDDDGLALLKTTKNTEGSRKTNRRRIEHVTGTRRKKEIQRKKTKKIKKRKTTTRNYCNRVGAKRKKKKKARPVLCRSMPTGSESLFAPATCRKLINGQGPGWVLRCCLRHCHPANPRQQVLPVRLTRALLPSAHYLISLVHEAKHKNVKQQNDKPSKQS